jgi:hypothetical protein
MKQDQQSPAAPPSPGANHAFYLGDWLVEPELNRIQRNGEKAHLEPKVMEVLVCLSRANGSVISKEQLIRQVWPDTFVTDDVLKVSIWQLRKAFQDDSKHPQVIEKLQRSRSEVVHLFDEVARTMPDGTYLTSFKQSGKELKFEGVAQSSTRVSTFMRNISADQWMKDPELEVVESKPGNTVGNSFVLDASEIVAAGDDDDDAPKSKRSLHAGAAK